MATTVRRRRDRDDAKAPGADRYRDEPDDDEDDLDDEEESPRAKRRRERDEEPRSRSRRSRDDDDDDEDEDERPARSRRRARDEDDDDAEPPARSRRRGREDDDDEDDDEDGEPRGRRGRRARDDDDDDDEPRRDRRRSRVDEEDDEEEDERPRRGRSRRDDDDDEDDADRPRRASSNGKSSGGWGQWRKIRQEMGNFNNLKLPDDESQILLKFLDDEPFATWGVHWLTLPRGRRPFVCLEEGCPLCDKLGDSPKPMAAFNVLVLSEDADPKLVVWEASPEPCSKIEAKSKARTGPLTKHYYAVSKLKKGGKKNAPTETQIDVVRDRDLREEWNMRPLSDAALEKFEKKMQAEKDYVKKATKQELRAVVREVMDDDD